MTRRGGAVLRHILWRAAWKLAGGLRIQGRPPVGPAVIVANHRSHADTAALLAALPAHSGPVVAAVEDYWFDVPWRRVLARSVVAAVPIRRGSGGGYGALRAAAAPLLARGRQVVIYPEGTRALDGAVGEFHSGALRLARDLNVPLVPVALVGTDHVLPKHGRFSPRGADVRFGTPIGGRDLAGLDPANVRERVVRLHGAAFTVAAAMERGTRIVGVGVVLAALAGDMKRRNSDFSDWEY